MKQMVGGCCVCSSEIGEPYNPIVYCDGHGCNVAVHKACYGILQIPENSWFCRKCESQERSARVRCELCPNKDGALKKTEKGGWCHVLCALFIPEVYFVNKELMEPIKLDRIPPERMNKICYICEMKGPGSGANFGVCMQCNKQTCRQFFHVTCAQASGLLCEESDKKGGIKYCGYCNHHQRQVKQSGTLRLIPAFKAPRVVEIPTPEGSPSKDNMSAASGSTSANGRGSGCGGFSNLNGGRGATSIRLAGQNGCGPPPLPDDLFQMDAASAQYEDDPPPPYLVAELPVVTDSLVKEELPSLVALGSDLPGGRTTSSSCSSTPSMTNDMGSSAASSYAAVSSPMTSTISSSNGSTSHYCSVMSSSGTIKIEKQLVTTIAQPSQQAALCGKRKRKAREVANTALQSAGTAVKMRKSPSAASSKSKRSPVTSVMGMHATSTAPVRRKAVNSSTATAGLSGALPSRSSSLSGPPILTVDDMTAGLHLENQPRLLPPLPRPYIPPSFPRTGSSYNKDTATASADSVQQQCVSMEELLEWQWEHSAHFLMQQVEPTDVVSLLSCLHQLQKENRNLESQVGKLERRKDHLLAVTARLNSGEFSAATSSNGDLHSANSVTVASLSGMLASPVSAGSLYMQPKIIPTSTAEVVAPFYVQSTVATNVTPPFVTATTAASTLFRGLAPASFGISLPQHLAGTLVSSGSSGNIATILPVQLDHAKLQQTLASSTSIHNSQVSPVTTTTCTNFELQQQQQRSNTHTFSTVSSTTLRPLMMKSVQQSASRSTSSTSSTDTASLNNVRAATQAHQVSPLTAGHGAMIRPSAISYSPALYSTTVPPQTAASASLQHNSTTQQHLQQAHAQALRMTQHQHHQQLIQQQQQQLQQQQQHMQRQRQQQQYQQVQFFQRMPHPPQ